MSAPKRYNGHHCWHCWNVSLWLNNDERLYNLAMAYAKSIGKPGGFETATKAASVMCFLELPDKTPDGATYTLKAVRAALLGMME